MLIVFDLDGTLAAIEHRLHHIQGEAKDWDAFFAACPDDQPIRVPLTVMRDLHTAGNIVEIWTGRSDHVRAETRAWLDRHGANPDWLTRMRRKGDHRPDTVVKRSWLHSMHRKDWPALVFEDRSRVVEMWRAEGVPCFQVAPGDFD